MKELKDIQMVRAAEAARTSDALWHKIADEVVCFTIFWQITLAIRNELGQ